MEGLKIVKTKKTIVPSAFQNRVYAWLSINVPAGKVTTYNRISKELNSSPRAIGQALRKNPFAPQIPCHRVINSDGKLGGYNGRILGKWVNKKIRLLKLEGVKIKNGRIRKEFVLR